MKGNLITELKHIYKPMFNHQIIHQIDVILRTSLISAPTEQFRVS